VAAMSKLTKGPRDAELEASVLSHRELGSGFGVFFSRFRF
jgi:hypothetical protein